MEQENKELKEKIDELKEKIDELVDDLKDEIDELKEQLENRPEIDDIEDKVVQALEWRFMRHPNPDTITLETAISEVKDAIKSFSS